MAMERHTCPVCGGGGRLFIRQRLGDLQTYREVPCSCWCCKGRGFVEHDVPRDRKSKAPPPDEEKAC
jgi:hypothetical protein